MKAILVIETDAEHIEDLYVEHIWNDCYPVDLGKEVHFKPLPEKKEIDIEPHLEFVPETYESGYTHGYERGKEIGWNDCIDAITGETE